MWRSFLISSSSEVHICIISYSLHQYCRLSLCLITLARLWRFGSFVGRACLAKKKSLIFYVRTGLDVLSQKFESSVSTFSDSFVVYFCSCHVLLVDFCTSATLTDFHVFTQLHSIIFKICFSGLSFYSWAAANVASVVCCFTLVQQRMPVASPTGQLTYRLPRLHWS